MSRNLLQEQVDSLPNLLGSLMGTLATEIHRLLPTELCRDLQRVYVAGCGDSHHAGACAALAFQQVAGLPCYPQPALQFSRYGASYLSGGGNLLVAISASGQVSRTIEALDLGQQAGAHGLAITGNARSTLAITAERVLEVPVPALAGDIPGVVVPGVRTFAGSLLALYLLAIHVGRQRGQLSRAQTSRWRTRLEILAYQIAETTAAAQEAAALVSQWVNTGDYLYVGAGPGYGAALFSAAKMLEASGDQACAQELEEWAHLQYFARAAQTPTFIITAGGADRDRVVEIATAARAIGRQVALIAPFRSLPARLAPRDVFFPLPQQAKECFSPLAAVVPGILVAAGRAQALDEPYFRAFGGGRHAEGGGGISRIRTSRRLTHLPSRPR